MDHDRRPLPQTRGGVGEDSATATRSGLAVAVACFAEAWEQASSPPDLAAYLPEVPGLRSVCLIELIKVDLTYRWRPGGHRKRLTEYVDEFPELRAMPLPPDLLYEEFHCLRRTGVTAEPAHDCRAIRSGWRTGDYRSTLIVRPRAVDALGSFDVGDQIDDFDLLLDLGSGAFARVFLARQRSMERLVALKISQDHGTEPQTLAQLDHQYIVRVFDKRLLADRDLKLMYMEYVPGGTLLGVLRRVVETPAGRRSGRMLLDELDSVLGEKGVRPHESGVRADLTGLSWPETVAWLGRRLAEALDYSTHHGVLHRDIKPANVLMTADGVPKLADFNISFSNHIAGASPAAYFGGSLAYMSPEQLEACHPQLPGRAEDLDGRSDIYALGVMLWELLTGRRPFDDETAAGDSATSLERMLAQRRRGIGRASLAGLPPDCPATLRRVLLTCLAPRPQDRWSSSAELTQQLQLCLDPRARTLVDPPLGSLRERLALRPVPIATTAVVVGQLLAAAYIFGHNVTLLNAHLPADAKPAFAIMTVIAAIVVPAVFGGLILYACRSVITVPWGVRKGRFDAAVLEKSRSDTLACGDRIALITLTGWLAALVVLGGTIVVVADLPTELLVNIFATHVVTGMIGATWPFFLVTFHVVRWYYPALLMYGTTTPTDAEQLRRLARRATQILVLTALIPPVGAAVGTAFLDPDDLHLIIGSIIWLSICGACTFVLSFGLYRTLTADLAALGRVVSTGLPHRGRSSAPGAGAA
ncbi:serine/threonine protein kinase [Rhodococcus sp. ZPP]|uniref:serine/threonine-protein kinase n=1 Tax=Rhodococcus sp. ZPP TaxID=2749906 RepID=UPI001AD85F17|nr:serine/threonine-protein kinase [Rhodococcus sp. ZPP]QTJ68636.1 serine/threonine protein kinase [Rhodococcus sp. ZPP]